MLRISPASLDWAIKHAITLGDTDIFPRPFEFEAIQHDWIIIRDYLSGLNVLDWTTRPHRTLLSPKARYGFRPATQLDPLDFIIYASLVYEIGSDLEAKRIPVAEETVFSYRFAPDRNGRIFDGTIGYRQFQARSESLSSGNTFSHVVVADIADFYPRIYVHRLENALNNATRKGNHVKALRNLLSGWNGTESYGIPVGSAPSRLLSEITISDVDDLLKAYGVTFVRFNDDYRLFATSKNQAYRMLTILADHLYSNHGLSLQPQKTKIVEMEHFRAIYLPTPEDRELDSFRTKFHDLVAELGLENNYEEIDPNNLDADQEAEIDRMNPEWLVGTKALWWVVALLRLKASWAISAPVFADCPFREVPSTSGARLFPFELAIRPKIHAAKDLTELAFDDLAWVAQNWTRAASLFHRDRNFALAFQAYDNSTTIRSPALGLLTLWSALEHLFAPSKQELRFRVSALIACYLTEPGEGRMQAQKKLAKLYDERSQAAHTAEQVEAEAASETFEIMSQVLLKIISEDRVPSRDFLEKLLFGAS